VREKVRTGKVARLAATDPDGVTHLVPIRDLARCRLYPDDVGYLRTRQAHEVCCLQPH
jgi:hypothetical protein